MLMEEIAGRKAVSRSGPIGLQVERIKIIFWMKGRTEVVAAKVEALVGGVGEGTMDWRPWSIVDTKVDFLVG